MNKIIRDYTNQINGKLSKEMTELCLTMDTLPGIETMCYSNGIGSVPRSIWFYSKNPVGLFILTRSIDKRYWEYGLLWDITLEVGDNFKDGYLPTTYWLHPIEKFSDENIQKHMISLTKNIELHFDDTNFLKHYNICLNDYKEKIYSYNRKVKINKIISE